METTNYAYAALAWALAFASAFCVAVAYRGERNFARLVTGSFLCGLLGFGVVAYLVRNGAGVAGGEWYYLFVAILVGSLADKAFRFVEKRSDILFDAIWKKLGLPDDENPSERLDPDHSGPGSDGDIPGDAVGLEERQREGDSESQE